MLFSIIIPAYNVERYIECCVRSVCGQRFDKSQFEVIVVDDCSTDSTLQLLAKLQNEYTNLIVIKHEINKRQGGGRNTGLRVAQGEYILFLDGDDCFVFDDVLKNFQDLMAIREDINVVHAFGYTSVPAKYCDILRGGFGRSLKIKYYDAEQFVEQIKFSAVWGNCYRRSFIMKNKLFFREHVVFEDTDWSLKAVYLAKTIGCLDYPYYGYRENDVSTTRRDGDIKVMMNNAQGAFAVYEYFSQLRDLSSTMRSLVMCRIKDCVVGYFFRIGRYKMADGRLFLEYLKNSGLLDVEYPKFRKIEKLKIWFIKYVPTILCGVLRFFTLSKRRVLSLLPKEF